MGLSLRDGFTNPGCQPTATGQGTLTPTHDKTRQTGVNSRPECPSLRRTITPKWWLDCKDFNAENPTELALELSWVDHFAALKAGWDWLLKNVPTRPKEGRQEVRAQQDRRYMYIRENWKKNNPITVLLFPQLYTCLLMHFMGCLLNFVKQKTHRRPKGTDFQAFLSSHLDKRRSKIIMLSHECCILYGGS